jgi:hypothetical protein
MNSNSICFIVVVYEFSNDLLMTLESIALEDPLASIFVKSAEPISQENCVEIRKYGGNIVIQCSYDSGIYDAWNQSLDNEFVLSHNFITFFGAGDLLNRGACREYDASIRGLSFDVLTSKSVDTFQDGRCITNGMAMNRRRFQKYFCINHSGVLYKTEWIKSRKFDTSFKSSGDYCFLLEHLDDAVFEFLDYPVSIYPVGGISSSSTLSIFESWRARSRFSSVSSIENIYLFLKAFIGFYIKIWRK